MASIDEAPIPKVVRRWIRLVFYACLAVVAGSLSVVSIKASNLAGAIGLALAGFLEGWFAANAVADKWLVAKDERTRELTDELEGSEALSEQRRKELVFLTDALREHREILVAEWSKRRADPIGVLCVVTETGVSLIREGVTERASIDPLDARQTIANLDAALGRLLPITRRTVWDALG
jgi:hypothetical protein